MGVNIIIKNSDYSGSDNQILIAKKQDATDIFIAELQAMNIYDKIKALWLFKNNTYDEVKLNIINPSLYTLSSFSDANLEEGLNLTALYSVSTGFTGDAGFIQNGHIAYYNSTPETVGITIPINDTNDTAAGTSYTLARSTGVDQRILFGLKGYADFTSSRVVERGLFVGTHSSNISSIYSRGVLIESVSKTNSGSSPAPMTIGTSTGYKSSMKLQLVSVGDALTPEEVVIFSNACEKFMTNLGR